EGLFFCIPVAIAILAWMRARQKAEWLPILQRVVLPLLAVFAVVGTAMLYYFWRTTGNSFRTPYMVDLATYNPVPYFPWQSLKPLFHYHHAALRQFYVQVADHYAYVRAHLVLFNLIRFVEFSLFFLGALLSVPVFLLGVILPYNMSVTEIGRNTRFLLLVFLTSLAALFAPIYQSPHYAAPITALIYALVILAMQLVRRWRWRGARRGVAVVRAIALSC